MSLNLAIFEMYYFYDGLLGSMAVRSLYSKCTISVVDYCIFVGRMAVKSLYSKCTISMIDYCIFVGSMVVKSLGSGI